MLYPAPESPQGLTLRAGNLKAGSLRPGQTYTGRIAGTADKLALQIGAQRIPLSSETGLAPGQLVQVRVTQQEGALQLQVLPQSAGAEAAAAKDLAGLWDQLARLISFKARPDQLQSLLPGALPRTPQAVEALLRALSTPGTQGNDLSQLTQWVQQAVTAGAIPRDVLVQLQAAMAPYAFSSEDDLQKLLGRTPGRAEARLAAALKNGSLPETIAALRQGLRNIVANLRGNEALRTYLMGQRLLKQFEQTTGRLVDQFSQEDLPALRSLDQRPYGYLEVPMPPNSDFLRLQVHWLTEHKSDSKTPANNNQFVIDLETTNLGPLWIHLQQVPGQCRCSLRVAEEQARDVLAGEADGLAESLEQAGYSNTRVQVSAWDGDRVEALTTFFGGPGNLDLTG
jgi:hypothetical protein